MKRIAAFLAVLALVVCAALVLPHRSNAVECQFTGILAPECNGHCVVFTFGYSASCGGTVDLQSRNAGGTTWTTVATSITSPYTYCPTNCGITCNREYRLVLTCGCGGPTYSGTLGPIDCQ